MIAPVSVEKPNMMLSKYFSLREMTKSQTALRKNINNLPSGQNIENLSLLCENILDPVREHFGKPFTPSSGYRSPALCKAIGSSVNSQHAKGEAADFEVAGVANIDLARWIIENLEFDQLILEYYNSNDPSSGWVHCSYKRGENRKQVLRYDGKQYTHGL